MARSRLCRACGDFHDIDAPWPSGCEAHFGHRPAQATYVRTDGMDTIVSPLDGKPYDSRSAYYGSVRRAGCEIVGDDRAGFGPKPEYRPQGVEMDIKRALESHR